MERHDVDAIVESVGEVLGEQLEKSKRDLADAHALIRSLSERIEALEKRDAVSAELRDALGAEVNRLMESHTSGIKERMVALVKEHAPKHEAPDFAAIIRDEVTRAVAELPKPENGKDAPPVDVDALVLRVAELIPVPKDGQPGEPGPAGERGKDAPAVDEAAIVARVLEQVPVPKDGEPGKPGEKGEPGAAAEPVNVADIVNQVVRLIPVPKDGATGPQGEPGKDAPAVDTAAIAAAVLKQIPPPKDGQPGKDGESIHPDSVRLMVLDEVRKAAAEIRPPKDGEPGRDALDIDILPAIEEGRSYPLRTFAIDKGGLWRRDSTGWTCVVSGYVGTDVSLSEDCRTFTVTERRSDGERTRTFSVPALLDAGGFKAGTEYKAGDVVSKDGAMFICQKDTTAVPGDSADWRLSVRKGRDGRDVRPDEPRKHTPVQLPNPNGKK